MGIRHLGVGLLLALGVTGSDVSVLGEGTCAAETVTVYVTGAPSPSVGAASVSPITPQNQGVSSSTEAETTTSDVVVTAVGSTVTSWLTLVSDSPSTTAEATQSGPSLPVASAFPTEFPPDASPTTTTTYASTLTSTAIVEPLPTVSTGGLSETSASQAQYTQPAVLSEASDGQPQNTQTAVATQASDGQPENTQSASPAVETQTVPETPAGTTYTTLIPIGTMGLSYTGPGTGAGTGAGSATSVESSEITSELPVTVAFPSTPDSTTSESIWISSTPDSTTSESIWINSSSVVAAASTTSVNTPVTPVTESMPPIASLPAETSMPASMSMPMSMNDTSLAATPSSTDLGAPSSLVSSPASASPPDTNTPMTMSMGNTSTAATPSSTGLGASSSFMSNSASDTPSGTGSSTTAAISTSDDSAAAAAQPSTSFSLSTSLVTESVSTMVSDTVSSSAMATSTALPVPDTVSNAVPTGTADFPFTTELSVNSSSGIELASAASTIPMSSVSTSDTLSNTVATGSSDFPFTTELSSSGIQAVGTTSDTPFISASPSQNSTASPSASDADMPSLSTSDQMSSGETPSASNTPTVTSVSVSIPTTDTVSEPTVLPPSSGLLPADAASSSSLVSYPQQPISLAMTVSSSLSSDGVQKRSSGDERISRTWAMSNLDGITHAAATPLKSGGAHVGKRQVGATVYATIDNTLVSWINTYSPTPVDAAMVSSTASDISGTASDISSNMSTVATLLSETSALTAPSETCTDGQPENTQPATITPASYPTSLPSLLSELSDGQPVNSQTPWPNITASSPTGASSLITESSESQSENTLTASIVPLSYPSDITSLLSEVTGLSISLPSYPTPTGVPSLLSEASDGQPVNTQGSSSLLTESSDGQAESTLSASNTLLSYPTGNSSASSTLPVYSWSPVSPVGAPTSLTTSSTVSNTSPPYSFSPSWNTTAGSTTFQTISGTPILSTSTVVSTGQVGTATSSAAQATCTGRESGAFTINFDDLPHYSVTNNQTTNLSFLANPYHHLTWANGWSYVPKPIEPFRPTSPTQMGIFNVNASVNPHSDNITSAPLPDEEFEGRFGAGSRYLNSAYWIDAFNASLGCKFVGPDRCEWYVNGWQVDETGNQVVAAHQDFTTSPCREMANCSLENVELDPTFRDLIAIQFVATIPKTGEAVTYFMDDLALAWSNKTCAATKMRQMEPDVTAP